jgi:hypothetical protein
MGPTEDLTLVLGVNFYGSIGSTMQAKTRRLTHTPPNPPTLGDFELAFVAWSKPRVLLPPELGGRGGCTTIAFPTQ